MSENTTNVGAPPTTTDEVAAAVETEATEGAAHFTAVADAAKEIRHANEYDGTLTAKMVAELVPIMHQPTPGRYVKHIPPTQGKPYASTGLSSIQFQQDMLNAAYGRSHWRELRHYPRDAGADYGFICKAVVVVGNDLSKASLDEVGNLVRGDADILVVSEEWGSVKNATAPADAFKGSATNALKRAYAAFGPGGDVYRAEFDDENVGGTGALTATNGQPQTNGASHGGGTGRRQPKTASDGQQRLLRRRASEAGIDNGWLANIILWANGTEAKTWQSPQQASDYLTKLLGALPGTLVDPVLDGITQAAQAHTQQQQAAVASDIPTDIPAQAVSPLQPVAVPAEGQQPAPGQQAA